MSSTQSEAGDAPPPAAQQEQFSTPFYNHQKRKKTLLLSAIAVLLLVAIVAIPTIIVTGNNKSSNSSNSKNIEANNGGGSSSNNNKDTTEDTTEDEEGGLRITPTSSPYLQAVLQYFIQEGVTSEQVFANTDSPQRKAAEWLAETDTFFETGYIPETNRTEYDGYRFMARYIMATNYFALGGDDWIVDLNFLSEQDICFWNYVEVIDEDAGESNDYGVFCGDDPVPLWIIFSTYRICIAIEVWCTRIGFGG